MSYIETVFKVTQDSPFFKAPFKQVLLQVTSQILSFLCYPIICLNILSSVLRCPLRFPHKNDVLYVIYVCLASYIIVFCFCFIFLRLFASFLWIVHFWLPLRYSLTFIQLLLNKNLQNLLHLSFIIGSSQNGARNRKTSRTAER